MQTQNRFLDDIARLFSNAAGAAQGLREEVEVLVRGQAERWAADLDLVTREEFEAVRSMAAAARAEADALAQRVAQLESALAKAGGSGASDAKPSDAGIVEAPLATSAENTQFGSGSGDAKPSDAGMAEPPPAAGKEEGPRPQPGT